MSATYETYDILHAMYTYEMRHIVTYDMSFTQVRGGGGPEPKTGIWGGHHWVRPTPEFGAGASARARVEPIFVCDVCLLLALIMGRGVY